MKKSIILEAIERPFLSNDWVTLTFLFCFLLLFLMKLHKPERLVGYSVSFFTQGFIEKRAETSSPFFPFFMLFSFLFGVTIISLTISLYTNQLYFTNFSIIFGLVACYLTLHFCLIFLLSKTFKIEKSIRYFLFTKTGYLYTICLWVFPLLIIHHYSFNNNTFLSLFIALLLIFRAFLIFKNNKKLIFKQLFYFILYLCTLELAPLLIIYKITTP